MTPSSSLPVPLLVKSPGLGCSLRGQALRGVLAASTGVNRVLGARQSLKLPNTPRSRNGGVVRGVPEGSSQIPRPAPLGNSLFESKKKKTMTVAPEGETQDQQLFSDAGSNSDSSLDFPREASRVAAKTEQVSKPVDMEGAMRTLDLALASEDLATALSFVQGQLETAPVEVMTSASQSEGLPAEQSLFDRRAAKVLDLALQEGDMEQVASAYDWLLRVGVVRNFGREKQALLSAEPRLVTPDVLRRLSGLEASKLSPKKFGGSSPLGPLVSIGIFSALVNNGIDVRPLALILLGLGIVDSVYLGGAGQAQLMGLWPGFRKRVLVHEAGHIVVAYLLGCPVRGVILDAFKAMDQGIKGQAGTQFWDSSLDMELKAGRLTGSSVDRYSVVLFAGIAAEALTYGEAEGGESDENLFKALVGNLQPEWSSAKVSNQARWAVGQACSLLRSNRKALTNVADALERGEELSGVVLALESALA